MKQLYKVLGYIVTPALLGLNYYYDESAWLYLYSLMCVCLLIFLVLAILSVLIIVKELNPTGQDDLIAMLNGITGWQRFVGYFYGIASFLYLTFTHHWFIATLSIFTSALGWALASILMHEIKQFKVKS